MSSQGRQESIRQTRHELAPFFGNHGGAELFIKLFIEPTGANGYERSINETDAESIINNQYASQFMKAESYGRRDPISDNDVHPQFTDFLIQTALFHRAIDEPAQQLPQSPNDPSNPAKILWDKVYMDWNNLTESSRAFYRKYLQFMNLDATTNTWKVIPEGSYGTAIPPYQGRVNLLKTSGRGMRSGEMVTRDPATNEIVDYGLLSASECPKFVNLIPKIPGSMGKIWYTAQDGTEQPLQTHTDSALKNIYCGAYKFDRSFQIDGQEIFPKKVWDPQTQYHVFDINVDKFTRKRFFNISAELKKPPKIEGPVFSLTDKNVWHVDETGRLYKDEGGNRVYYDVDSDETKRILTKNFNCYSTFTKDNAKCNMYVNQCLLRSDPESLSVCTEFWKNHDFYKVTIDEIKQMHPMVAVRTLEKFGFRVKKVEDSECKMLVRKFETVEHWMKTVLTGNEWKTVDPSNNKTLQNTIEENENLLNYLRLLVEYVNANPAILNGKEFAAKTAEAVGRVKQSDLAMRLGIQMAKVPAGRSAGMYDFSMLQSHLGSRAARRPLVASFSGPNYRSSFGALGASGMGVAVPFQMGGVPNINSYIRRVDANVITGASALQALIDKSITDLQNKGITIAQEDQTAIVKKLDTMHKIETELINTDIFLEEYVYMLDLFPPSKYKSEMLSLDKIKAFVEKQKDLLSTQATEDDRLVTIYGSLQKLLAGLSDDFVEEGYEPVGRLGFNTTEKARQTTTPFSVLAQQQKPPCF